MTHTQPLKEIRPEHSHKGYIVHPLDHLRHIFAGTDDRYILNGVVQGRHPGISLSNRKVRREIASKHFCKALCGAVSFVAVWFFRKIKHCLLVFPKRVCQMPEYSGIALEYHRICIFWNFFKLQGVGCGFYGKLHIFQRIVRSKDFFNLFSVFWNIHVGERRYFTENTQHYQSGIPCHRKECRSVLSCVQHTKQQIDFLALLVHLGKSICRNIQRITGKSADR